jgi:hypothetical protein
MIEAVTLEEGAKFILNDLRDLYEIYKVAETTTEYNKKSIASITEKISELRYKITNASA